MRRVPKRFAGVDDRDFVRLSLHTDSETDAKARAVAVWADLVAGWELALSGRSGDAQARFDAARKIAGRMGFRYHMLVTTDNGVEMLPSIFVPNVEKERAAFEDFNQEQAFDGSHRSNKAALRRAQSDLLLLRSGPGKFGQGGAAGLTYEERMTAIATVRGQIERLSPIVAEADDAAMAKRMEKRRAQGGGWGMPTKNNAFWGAPIENNEIWPGSVNGD